MKDHGLEYIRGYYRVPAFKGVIVKYQGKSGIVMGSSGPHVKVKLDEAKHARPYHPDSLEWPSQDEAARQFMEYNG